MRRFSLSSASDSAGVVRDHGVVLRASGNRIWVCPPPPTRPAQSRPPVTATFVNAFPPLTRIFEDLRDVSFFDNRQKPRSTVTQLRIRSLQRLLASPAARTQGTFSFAEWLVQQRSWVEGHRTIELGRHVHFHCRTFFKRKIGLDGGLNKWRPNKAASS
ncbi:hypothetical protein RHMOL_Rhmol04G0163100 [Rhododendron molle]|uniref:Uncharacterized protein n=1 Tax=Rhododendron molle TaxID=49168 RepID=A0ACC0P2C2_RHOML|nr:hypothetical protein RHMOL_Rhmol04G0163100 [Rhododendron molle]